ncbi:hypothetical protein CDAR_390411 [Caerostris darwini]|uniref:Uncharacterized protein n=1 Tax=Caerostris darwini TaxID=1538125 RepID=A0AAV4NXG8_9ARAC|nr:hypothetical protein CDAR_390411 [Caerostris darwini]
MCSKGKRILGCKQSEVEETSGKSLPTQRNASSRRGNFLYGLIVGFRMVHEGYEEFRTERCSTAPAIVLKKDPTVKSLLGLTVSKGRRPPYSFICTSAFALKGSEQRLYGCCHVIMDLWTLSFYPLEGGFVSFGR